VAAPAPEPMHILLHTPPVVPVGKQNKSALQSVLNPHAAPMAPKETLAGGGLLGGVVGAEGVLLEARAHTPEVVLHVSPERHSSSEEHAPQCPAP
jgi:hypothetical protein